MPKKIVAAQPPSDIIPVYEPEFSQYIRFVYPLERRIFVNTAASPGANIIRIMYPQPRS